MRKLEVLETYRLGVSVKPKMELTLHELNIRHQELIRLWRQARDSNESAHRAYMAIQKTVVQAYGALASFEADLEFFQEKSRLEGMERFQLVTVEPPEEVEAFPETASIDPEKSYE